MRKVGMVLFVVFISAMAFAAAEPKDHTDHTKVGCSCSPACSNGNICCSTGSGCGCFPFSSCP